jgi:two-component system, OmpR family, sensor kinase
LRTSLLADWHRPRSLRLRLMLWYGALLAIALSFFALLVLTLATDALNQSVTSAINAEARIASLDVKRGLLPNPPYWPNKLSLNTIDTYREPGIAIEIEDAQGNARYTTLPNHDIPVSTDKKHLIMAGQSPVWYKATIDGERVQVEALPVHAPGTNVNGKAAPTTNAGGDIGGAVSDSGPVIGVLLVAKSLSDVNSTLLLLQTLLLFVGLTTLGGTLVASWLIASRVLRPIAGIVTTARSIATSTARGTRLGNLNQRVPRPLGRDELALVVDTFNEMLASLESATKTQRRFVADASHELRAPLTTIQGNLAFLQHHYDELPTEERRTMLADAHEETLRLAKLVEELLLLARADASIDAPAEVQKAETAVDTRQKKPLIELDHVVLQLVRQLRRRLAVEGSALKLELGHVEPVRVRGDEETLRRVILILLDNAIKYTPTDKEDKGRVIISLQRVQGEAVLRVRDTGIGIEPADLEHIFERFYRADRARSRQGTGLGLSIAQTLVTQLGGRITAESTPGKDSTFSVWLPLA